ncbi:MAG: acyl-CoA dehydratase activase-related protein [Thermodesulfobacteriota bacterium]
MTRVGVARGLLFYRYFPLWETFLQSLGIEVFVSAPTSEAMIRQGSKLVPTDLCLPIKIYFGHIESLKKEVDFLFVPRYISIEPDAYMCPKFIGLPDMVLCTVDSLPPLIDLPIHCKAQGMEAEKTFYLQLGKIFSKDRGRIENAYSSGLERQNRFRKLLQKGLPFEEALDRSKSQVLLEKLKEDEKGKLGIIGRPYYVHDPFLRKSVVEQVEARGYRLLTTEVLTDQEIEKGIEKLRKRIYWSFGKEMVGSAIGFAQNGSVQGIINLASFGCGQDSFNFELIQHYVKDKIPILSLVFDEHLSNVGFSTRIEAFLEMLARRKNRGW